MPKKNSQPDPKKIYAAQNAQDGLINVADLSLLTGVAVPQLTKFAKTGQIEHFGEYHGSRFYNFQTLINQVVGERPENEAGKVLRESLENELRSEDCPFFFESAPSDQEASPEIKIGWRVPAAA